MEQITGRLVRNAEIKKTKDGRELVAFTLAVNDRYKPKGKDEVKETRFFSCAYWLGTKVKDALKQGNNSKLVWEGQSQCLQRLRW